MTKLDLMNVEVTDATGASENVEQQAPKFWRSLEHQRGYDQTLVWTETEFPFGPAPEAFSEQAELTEEGKKTAGFQRREALKLMGASMALAGVTTGCVRRPEELILPYVKQPEDIIPGVANYYATAFPGPSGAVGLVVESHEGRPTKVEGNPDHPASMGKSDRFHQAEVLEVYDPDRTRSPMEKGEPSTWAKFDAAFATALKQAPGGEGLALVIDNAGGPTRDRVLHKIKTDLPKAKVYVWEPLGPDNTIKGAEMVFGPGQRVHLDLSKAARIVSVDSDFMTEGPDSLRLSAGWSSGRRFDKVAGNPDEMNRLYVMEPGFSTTGSNADHRLRVARGHMGDALKALAAAVFGRKALPEAFGGSAATGALISACATKYQANNPKFIQALTNDLVAAVDSGKGAAIVVGEAQPPEVHALGHLLNAALGSFGNGVASLTAGVAASKAKVDSFFAAKSSEGEGGEDGEGGAEPSHWAFARPTPHVGAYEQLAALVKDLEGGKVKTLVILGPNPAFSSPGALKVKEALGKAGTVVHAGLRFNETSEAATWHVPLAHWLESWGDAVSWDGSVSVVQPLIKPLHGGRSALELLASIAGLKDSAHDLVKATWMTELETVTGDKAWRQTLHKGLLPEKARRPVPLVAADGADAYTSYISGRVAGVIGQAPAAVASALKALKPSAPSAQAPEVVFKADFKVADGRYGNNAWLQEMPDSMSKLCWDNALLMGPKLANDLGIRSTVFKNSYQADEARLTVGDTTVVLPVFMLPGIAPDTVVVATGYGRTKAGHIGDGVGVDAWSIVPADGKGFASGKLERTGRQIELCSTQEHFALEGADRKPLQDLETLNTKLGEKRPLTVVGTVDGYKQDRAFAQKGSLRVVSGGKLVDPPERRRVTADGAGPAPGRPDRPIQPTNDVFEYDGQQWGMAIDLTTCTGCHACVMACQSENNIPIVGRAQVLFGRELHWIRIDRYYVGDVDEPEALQQPINCLHCENAPCEPVCPVAATVHDSEGLNGMIYNRCIGTRYCANNCPVKVRRFNYFDFSKTAHFNLSDEEKRRNLTIEMQRNPDVTVRFRGVIEKCSYCTQRINEAKMKAKRAGQDSKNLPDGAITPACAQSCPTDAIAFGNINDPESKVSKMKATDRNYEMLSELNIRPRTTYLARIRNPYKELG
jgi:Fe-S-cluster-containing dehydrogenase component